MSRKSSDFRYPKNVSFHCTRCTLCCGDTEKRNRHIIMLEVEARKISARTSQPIVSFACRIEGTAPYIYEMRKKENGKCVFLKQNSCRVYASRPLVCRFYPFELKSDEKGAHIFSFTKECSGIGEGKRVTQRHFEKLFEQATDQLG